MYSYFKQIRSGGSLFGTQPPPLLPPPPPSQPSLHHHTFEDEDDISDTNNYQYSYFLGFFPFLELYCDRFFSFLLLLTVFILISSVFYLINNFFSFLLFLCF